MNVTETSPAPDASRLRVAVAVSSFNAPVTEGLLRGALEYLEEAGCADVTVARVPGSFELPLLCRRLAEAGFDAVVALGAVIKGETDHYEHIATQAARGLMDATLATGVPIGFGVLTAREAGHAVERSKPGPGNKGIEAAEAAVAAALLLDALPGGAARVE